MKKTSRFMVRLYLGTGVLFIVSGFAQFFFFLGLDELGVVEVGNALGLGLLVWIAVAVGILFLLLGLMLGALLGQGDKPRARVPGSPFSPD